MNGNANLNANNLTTQNVQDWQEKLNINETPSNSTISNYETPVANTNVYVAEKNGTFYGRYGISGNGNIGFHLKGEYGNDIAYQTQYVRDNNQHVFNCVFNMKKGQIIYCAEMSTTYNWGGWNFVPNE